MADDVPVKTATVDDLRKDGELVKRGEPFVVKDGGWTIGVFHPYPFPLPDESIPLDARRELSKKTGDEIRRQLAQQGITEEQIEQDIAALRKDRGGR